MTTSELWLTKMKGALLRGKREKAGYKIKLIRFREEAWLCVLCHHSQFVILSRCPWFSDCTQRLLVKHISLRSSGVLGGSARGYNLQYRLISSDAHDLTWSIWSIRRSSSSSSGLQHDSWTEGLNSRMVWVLKPQKIVIFAHFRLSFDLNRSEVHWKRKNHFKTWFERVELALFIIW